MVLTAPGAATGVKGVSGNGQVTVSWTAPSSDGGAAITGYKVTAAPGGATGTTTGATSVVVKGLTNGKPYTFTVTATNPAGTGTASAVSGAVVPLSPEVTYGHDDLGRMTAVFDSSGAGSRLSYDEVGNITGIVPLPAASLAVAQFSPERAPVGASVNVYGTGFGTDATAVSVSFNGTKVTPTAANLHRNRLTVTVPAGATAGAVTVTVGTASATYSGFTLTATALPTITGLSTALVNSGDQVTITGTGFNPDPTLDVLSVDGTVAHADSATATSITYTTPPTHSFGHVTVSTPAGKVTAAADVVSVPTPFATTDVAWVGRIKNDGTATTVSFPQTQKVGLALFDVPAGQRAMVSFTGSTLAGCYEIHVWSPGETVADHSESVCGDSYFDLPDRTAPGTYEIEIQPASTDTGAVTVAATVAADVTGVVSVGGAAASLTTTFPGQHAVYSFTGTAGQRVFTTVTAVANATTYADARLVGLNGVVLGSTTSQVSYSAGARSDIDTVTLPATGTYTVVVDPTKTGTGTYSAAVTAVPADVAKSGTIDGGAVSFPLTTLGQNGALTFTGTAGQRIFTLLSVANPTISSGCADVIITAVSTNAQIAEQVTCGTSGYVNAAALPTTGAYTISVDPQGFQTGTVSVSVLSVPADAQVAAAADGTARQASVTYGQSADYTFTATAGQRIMAAATLSGATTGFSGSLYGPDGSYITGAISGYISTRVLAAAGTYTLTINPSGAATGTTSATVYTVPADVAATAPTDGTATTATTTAPGQGAVFSFPVTAGQTISASCSSNLSNNSSSGVPTITLVSPSGSTVTSDSYGCKSTAAALFASQAAVTGTYTITAAMPGASYGGVTLQVNASTFVTATAPLDGTAVAATTTAAGQKIRISFTTATANQPVYVIGAPTSVTTPSSGTTYAYLYDPSGTKLATKGMSKTDAASTWFGPLTAATVGTYVIEIDPPADGTGTFTVQAFGSFVTATATVGGAQVPVTTTKTGQKARVTFTTAAANQTGYVIGAPSFTSPSGGYASAYLYDPSGTKLATKLIFSTDAASTWFGPLTLAAAGTYTIQIEPPADATGTFGVQVFNSFVTATAAVDGAQVSVATTIPGQKARISFTTTVANQTVYVVGAPTMTTASNGIGYAYLYGPTGTTKLATKSMFKGDAASTWFGPLTVAAAGTYTIQIEPPGDGTGTFKVNVYGSFVSTAATVDGAQVSVTTTGAGQKARISFTTTVANQTVYVIGAPSGVTTPSSGYTYAYLYDPTGATKLATKLIAKTDAASTWFGPLTLAAAGTYTIQIEPPADGFGTFKAQVFGSFVTATAAIDGAQVSLTTTKPGQKAKVSFTTTTANQVLYVSGSSSAVTSSTDFTYFYLINPAGTKLTSAVTNTTAVKNLYGAQTLATAGTYVVQIEPPATLSGTLTIKVSSTAPSAVAAAASATPKAVVRGPNVRAEQRALLNQDKIWSRGFTAQAAKPIPAVWPRTAGAPVWSQRPASAPDDARLSGRILTTEGKPLAHVTVIVDGRSTTTDRDGKFSLHKLPEGTRVLRMDARTASTGAATYGVFDVQVHLKKGDNALFYTPYLPALDAAHEVDIPSPTTKEVVITNPGIPGLEVHIPAGVTVLDADGKPVHRLGITPIPVTRTPIPMPQGVQVPVYYTIQPAGGRLVGGSAWLVYPNYLNQKPGTPVNFWHYEKHGEGWETYGSGTVDPAGKQVQPDPGTRIEDFDGAMINVSGWLKALAHMLGDAMNFAGDPVDLQTGLFQLQQTDLTVADVMPLQLTRAYNSGDTYMRPMGVGENDLYDTFLSSQNQYQEADLNFTDGSTVHFTRTTPGTSYTTAAFKAVGTTTQFAGAVMVWNGNGWNLRLTTGETLVYGENAPLQKIVDPNGNTVSILRTSKGPFGGYIGDITEVRSPNGYWLHYTYDTSDRITQVQDSGGRTVKYTYDTTSGTGHLKTVTDPANGVTTYGYDTGGRLTTITDARTDLYLTNTYDANGRVATQAMAGGLSYTFAYTLDANKNVTATTVTDNSGNKRTVAFDANGRTASDTLAAGTSLEHTVSVTRDPATQLPAQVSDGLGRTVTSAYDTTGQIIADTAAAGGSSAVSDSATYNNTPFGLPDTVKDPRGYTSTFSYDMAGNMLSATDPLGHKATATYNSQGQLLTSGDSGGTTGTVTYDRGEPDSVTDALGHTTRYFRDALGRVVVTTGPDGSSSRVFYNATNQILKTVDARGDTTQYLYDANGNVTSITDARQSDAANPKSTTYIYDAADRLTSWTDSLGATESYSYDSVGRLATDTDRNGKVVSYAYDAYSRVSVVGYGRTGTAPNYAYESTLTYTYDSAGRLASVADSTPGAGTVTYGYDSLDRLISETSTNGSVGYGYDTGNNLTSVTPSGLAAITYNYDKTGQIYSATQGSQQVGYTYDQDNRLATETLPDGIVLTFTRDAAGEVTKVVYTSGSTTVGDLDYTYDSSGRTIAITGSLAATSLPAAQSGETYDAANRLTAVGSTTYTYDADGNLLSDGTSGYTWTARGQLSSVTGSQPAALTYDPVGRLATSTVGGTATTYQYSGQQQVRQAQTGGASLSYFVGPNTDNVLSSTSNAGVVQTYLPGTLGSTIALADSTGAVTASYTYDPFGTTTAPSGDTNPIRFTGLPSGPGLPAGLQYNRARFYSPTLHRFISQDPIGFSGGDANLYQYAAGDPVDNADPTGNFVQILAACGIGSLVNDLGGWLSGKKHSFGDYLKGAAKGCAMGVVSEFAPEVFMEGGADSLAARFLAEEESAAADGLTAAPQDLYAFGNAGGPRSPRAGVDYVLDENGMVVPQSGLVNPVTAPRGASTFGDPQQSPLSGAYHGVPAGTPLPPGFGVVADGADAGGPVENLTHHTIYPTISMPEQDFIDGFLNLPWSRAGTKKK